MRAKKWSVLDARIPNPYGSAKNDPNVNPRVWKVR